MVNQNPRRSVALRGFVFVAGLGLMSAPGLAKAAEPMDHTPPAAAGSMAPNWVVDAQTPTLSWLEPTSDGRQSFRLAVLSAEGWKAPTTIVTSHRFFANWADLPGVAAMEDGTLVAHWLEKTGPDTYAYGIELARSNDGGAQWARMGRLHDDATETEHGFVSWVKEGTGLRAFWLDGRATATGGPMALRTALAGAAVSPGEVLDDRVCDCCQTGAARSSEGAVVVFRDRSADEIRDIGLVRRIPSGWSQPALVAVDGWKIPGCPVNGPQVAAAGRQVVVAWFTSASGGSKRTGNRVQLAFSADAGASFGPPLDLDPDPPLGRIALTLDPEGNALVAWMASANDQAEIRLRRIAASGKRSAILSLGRSTAGRASGFPRITLTQNRLLAAWVEAGAEKSGSRLRVTEVSLSALPLR